MTYETYENLKRVNSRRKHRATYAGNWKEVEECCNQDNQLDQEYARSISPEPVGHPDNPIFVKYFK